MTGREQHHQSFRREFDLLVAAEYRAAVGLITGTVSYELKYSIWCLLLKRGCEQQRSCARDIYIPVCSLGSNRSVPNTVRKD